MLLVTHFHSPWFEFHFLLSILVSDGKIEISPIRCWTIDNTCELWFVSAFNRKNGIDEEKIACAVD